MATPERPIALVPLFCPPPVEDKPKVIRCLVCIAVVGIQVEKPVRIKSGKFDGELVDFLVEANLSRPVIMFVVIQLVGIHNKAVEMRQKKGWVVEKGRYSARIGWQLAVRNFSPLHLTIR